ncbi:MAG: hypothetical protein ACI9NC_005613, partial [Verrucomicrobiales bacterium]
MGAIPQLLLRGFLSLAVCLYSASAATVTISGSSPVVNEADIANDNGASDAGGDQGHVWSNRPHQGQSFTTGADTGGYLLKAVTFKNLNNNISNSPTFNVRVGTLTATGSPEVFTQIGTTETAVAPNYAPLDYLTFTFATPLSLDANQLYAVMWGSAASGFVSVNNLNDSIYPRGTAFSSGGNNTPDYNNVILRNVDRVFHLDIETLAPSGVADIGNLAATGIATSGATLNGEVLDIGDAAPAITIRWGNEDGGSDPNGWDNAEVLPGTQGVGAFSAATATALAPNTTYFFTAFATNSAGDSVASPSPSFT